MLSILQGLKASQYVIGLHVLHFHWSSYFFIGRGLKTIKFRSLWEVIWQSLYLKTSKLYHNCNIMTHLKQIIWNRSCRKVTTSCACAHCMLFEKNFVCLHLSTTLKTNFQCVSCHVNHGTHQTFPMIGPNVWWEISQIWIKYIKPIRQMSDKSWKFFRCTVCAHYIQLTKNAKRWPTPSMWWNWLNNAVISKDAFLVAKCNLFINGTGDP